MMTVSERLLALLRDERVLTIQRTPEGFMLSLSDVESDGRSLFFVPDQLMFSEKNIEECLQAFYEQQTMQYVRGFQA